MCGPGVRGMSSNDDDIHLLRTDPGALVVRYRPAVTRMVEKYAEAGSIAKSEVDDVVQNICEKLLRAAPSLSISYQGKSLLSTYLYTVVQNFLNQEYGALRRVPGSAPYLETLSPVDAGLGASVDLQWFFRRFQAILHLFGRKKAKVLLGLRIFSGVPVSGDDVLDAYPNCPGTHLLDFLIMFGNRSRGQTDTEAFLVAGELIAGIEEKKRAAPDSFRRWLDLQIDEILSLLNGRPKTYHFDREIFRSFLVYFFQYDRNN